MLEPRERPGTAIHNRTPRTIQDRARGDPTFPSALLTSPLRDLGSHPPFRPPHVSDAWSPTLSPVQRVLSGTFTGVKGGGVGVGLRSTGHGLTRGVWGLRDGDGGPGTGVGVRDETSGFKPAV